MPAAGLAAAALTVPLFAAPAAAEPASIPNPDTGLVFYSSNPLAVVARQATPDGYGAAAAESASASCVSAPAASGWAA